MLFCISFNTEIVLDQFNFKTPSHYMSNQQITLLPNIVVIIAQEPMEQHALIFAQWERPGPEGAVHVSR